MTRRTRTGLPAGTFLLVATRFLVYLGVQAAYFIGIIGTLTYEVGASTWALAGAVGFFNLFIIFGNAAGGTLLDVRGPRLHAAVTLAVAVATSVLFQLSAPRVANVLAMSCAFGFATGLGFAFLSAYPAYLTDDADELKRVNALLAVVSNVAVVVGPVVGGLIATVLPAQRVFLAAAVFSAAAALPAYLLVERVLRVRAARVRSRVLDASEPMPDAPGANAPGAAASDDPGATAPSAAAPEPAPDAPSATFADSVRTVFTVPSLALLFGVGVLAYTGYGAFDPLESLFYRDVLHVGISWMGWLSSAAGAGSVIGSLLAIRVPRAHVNVLTLILLIALQGVGCLLYVGTPYVACALAGQMVLGCAFGMVTPLQNTLVQMHAPIEVLGRVNSVMNAGFNGAGALPLFAAPALAAIFGVQGVLVGASLVVLAVPLVYLVVRRRTVARIVAEERKRGQEG